MYEQFLVTSPFLLSYLIVIKTLTNFCGFTVMVLKRDFDEEGSGKSSPSSNFSQTAPNKFQKVVKYVMKEVSLQEIAAKIALILEPTLRKVVKEELEQRIGSSLQSSPRRSLVHQPESFPLRGLQLLFIKKLPPTLFTNSRIEDDEVRAPLQVQLVEANSKNVIRNGQLSSIKVEIVVLSGDFLANGRENWSESEFNDNIVREREGKRPLLIGELSIVLVNGVGSLGNVSFTDNSSWIRSRKFKLGVRAVSTTASIGTGIKEAVSEAFVVLDHRGESYQKHSRPSLDDPVWRLKKISKQGASHKKLEAYGIKTVKDFLMHYHMNSSSLRRVLGKGVANRVWDTMVRHANECHLDNTYYRYPGEADSAELVFNCVYKLTAVKFTGQDYLTVDFLDSREKALVEKLKQSAFLNLNELVPVHSSSVISPVELPTIEHNVPFSSAHLGLQDGSFSIIDQAEPEKQLDYNLSDTASYPCNTAEEGYLPEDESTSQTNQPVPVPQFSQAAFMMGNSSAAPSDGGYSWYQNSPITTFGHNMSQFGELTDAQTAPLYPFPATWGQLDDLFTISTPAAQYGIPFHTPEYGVNISGNGSPRAGWCKIRAAVMWKIVRRNAAARKKSKFAFRYY